LPRRGQSSRRDREGPLALHRIARVHGHVDERRLELDKVCPHPAALVGELGQDLNPRSHDGAQHLGDRADALARVKHLGFERLPPGEGEQLPREPGRAVNRVGDRIDVAAAALLGEIRPTQEIGRGLDDREQVVEVVRDTARQLAHGLHLLGLTQGLLGLSQALLLPPPFGDVQGEVVGASQLAAGAPKRAELDLVPARAARGVAELARHGERLARERPRKVSTGGVALLREAGEQVDEVVASDRM
jgi:hypothetical protein